MERLYDSLTPTTEQKKFIQSIPNHIKETVAENLHNTKRVYNYSTSRIESVAQQFPQWKKVQEKGLAPVTKGLIFFVGGRVLGTMVKGAVNDLIENSAFYTYTSLGVIGASAVFAAYQHIKTTIPPKETPPSPMKEAAPSQTPSFEGID
jgi:hypothetical protein